MGVLSQVGADEMHETRVGGAIKKGLDRITSLFDSFQKAEAEHGGVASGPNGGDGGFKAPEDDEYLGRDVELARLIRELNALRQEYFERKSGSIRS